MESLFSLYKINSKSGHEENIKRFVRDYLFDIQLDIREDDFGNVYITKGQTISYPCVAAHLDEVHAPGSRYLHVKDDNILYALDESSQQTGLGADDKNGVWVVLQLLKTEETMKAVLFVQEEKDGDLSGCRGSNACDLSFFDDVRYILQCDRKGSSDIVTFHEKTGTRLCDDDFIPHSLRSHYGYEPVHGGKTDVVALKMRGLKIPCCNISCGYYNAHKAEEYTIWPQLLNCLDFVRCIFHEL